MPAALAGAALSRAEPGGSAVESWQPDLGEVTCPRVSGLVKEAGEQRGEAHWSMDLAARSLCEWDQRVGVTLHTLASKQHLFGDEFARVSLPAMLLMAGVHL